MYLKKNFRLTAFIITLSIFFLQSDLHAQFLDATEHYIKTQIQEHNPGDTGQIRIYYLGTVPSAIAQADINLTAYKWKNEKKLVLTIRPYNLTPSGLVNVKTFSSDYFLTLTVEEARAIINNKSLLEKRIKTQMAIPDEYIYQDYTVNDSLFISYRATVNGSGKRLLVSTYLDIWINSVKLPVDPDILIGYLNTFISY